MSEFDRFRALSFDCYGTLIDWETGLANALAPWAESHGVQATPGQLIEEHGAIESVVQRETPGLRYPAVLAEVLRRLAAQHGVDATDDECRAFGGSVPDWPAFPDSAEALANLQQRFQLIILSNIDRTSFAASNRRLGVEFDLVLTAEDIGSYKPDPRNFDALLASLDGRGLAREHLLHVAQSLFHDHVPAKAIGLPTVWIDRRHSVEGFGATPAPDSPVTPDWRFESLEQFAAATAV